MCSNMSGGSLDGGGTGRGGEGRNDVSEISTHLQFALQQEKALKNDKHLLWPEH